MKKLGLIVLIAVVAFGLVGCENLFEFGGRLSLVGTWAANPNEVAFLTFYDDSTFTLRQDMFQFNHTGTWSSRHEGNGGPGEDYGTIIMDMKDTVNGDLYWAGTYLFHGNSQVEFDFAQYPEGWNMGGGWRRK